MRMVNDTAAALQLATDILERSQYWLGRIKLQDEQRDDFATEELMGAVNRADYPDDLRYLEALCQRAITELRQPTTDPNAPIEPTRADVITIPTDSEGEE